MCVVSDSDAPSKKLIEQLDFFFRNFKLQNKFKRTLGSFISFLELLHFSEMMDDKGFNVIKHCGKSSLSSVCGQKGVDISGHKKNEEDE